MKVSRSIPRTFLIALMAMVIPVLGACQGDAPGSAVFGGRNVPFADLVNRDDVGVIE